MIWYNDEYLVIHCDVSGYALAIVASSSQISINIIVEVLYYMVIHAIDLPLTSIHQLPKGKTSKLAIFGFTTKLSTSNSSSFVMSFSRRYFIELFVSAESE